MGEAVTQIPEFFKSEFATNWEHLLQQKESRLKNYATIENFSGKEKFFNEIDAQTMTRKTTRAGQTARSDLTLGKYVLRKLPYELANLFDEYDQDFLGDIVLPTSATIKSHAMAYMRACDQTIIDALEGTRYTGELGTTANALSQTVAVNYVPTGSPANSGLTLAKLIQAKSILETNEIDPEDELIFAYSQKQLDDLLLNVSQVSSSDYADIKALVHGNIDMFMGFKFVKTQLLTKNSSTDVRTCLAYVKSGVKFAGSDRRSYMDIIPAESHSLQVRTTANMGATRTLEEKVVAVYCDESP